MSGLLGSGVRLASGPMHGFIVRSMNVTISLYPSPCNRLVEGCI